MRFTDGIDKMLEDCPDESVTGHLVVDQVYAHYQHAHPEFHHPDGGQAFYLSEPLFVKVRGYMAHLGAKAVTPDGCAVEDGMVDNMEDLSWEVYERAPWEFGDLRASGHPIVEVDGKTAYDRPPKVHRLSAEELKIKAELRYLFDPHRYRR